MKREIWKRLLQCNTWPKFSPDSALIRTDSGPHLQTSAKNMEALGQMFSDNLEATTLASTEHA